MTKRRSQPRSPQAVARRLADFFERNGYVRRQDPRRVGKHGWDRYKKGDEVRLVAESKAELRLIRRLLRAAGFKAGRPFPKGRQHRQPVYGRQAVARFLDIVVACQRLRARRRRGR